MNIIVIGLGSMGKRRIRLIKNNFEDAFVVGCDFSAARRQDAENLFGITSFTSVKEAAALVKLDTAFVCTAPLSHCKIITECLELGLHVFTELNLVTDGYREIMELAKGKKKTLFLSSTFLFRKEIGFVIDAVAKQKSKVSYIYHVGQYLPDWHPWETIDNFFVSEKRTNGCREIFAIEMPWIIRAFGAVEDVISAKSNMSSLNVGYPDNYSVIIRHKNGNRGMLSVDIVSRKAVRNLEVFSEDAYIFWRGNPDALCQYNIKTKQEEKLELYSSIIKDESYSSTIIENAYLDEIKEFFGLINGKGQESYSFEEDIEVLRIIDKIEGLA